MKKYFSFIAFIGLLVTSFLFTACQQPTNNSAGSNSNQPTENTSLNPSIEISPVRDGDGDYKILTADNFKISVNAKDAKQVDLLYQPVMASDRLIKLATLSSPVESNKNLFEKEMKSPQDFNGEVWALVRYADGQNKETEHITVAVNSQEASKTTEQGNANSNTNTNSTTNQPADDNESAREDKVTGGKIQHAEIQPGQDKLRITVNVPAFLLTLWQGDKEIKTYYVGVGRKNFPIPAGMREAEKIILNPDWIPPDSEWVRKSSSVEPYERIPASSSNNPLGKIKIPLGDAYLLHEAESAEDIGNLVSHGCVRVMRNDLFDLTKLIIQGRNLQFSQSELDAAKNDSKRRVIELGSDLPVDINYDSMVVENGVLTIYPDVYEKKTNTVEELRAELENYKIDVSKIDDATLKQMIDKVNKDQKFSVSLEDIRAGNGLENSKVEWLTPYQDDSKQVKNSGKPAA